jgi:integrase
MIIVKYGNITDKEMSRIWQIMNNVFVYARDCDVRSCPLHDWDRIKRQIPYNRLVKSEKHDEAVASKDVEELIYEVVERRIYSVHQCCSLLLCMNFYLGLRVGELAVLSFSDFDFDRNVVRIYKTETKFFTRDESGKRNGGMNYRVTDSTKTIYSVREIPILPEVKYFYDLIKKEHKDNGYESQYLAFDGTYGVFVRALDRTLRNLCKLCDIPYFSTHMIRKTFATKLHFANVPTRVISDILGHSEIGTTEKSYIKNYKDKWQMTYNYMKEGLVYGHN